MEIRFPVETFLTGKSYMEAGGYNGKAVPFEYIEILSSRIIDYLSDRFSAYTWEIERGKWGTEVVGCLKDVPDPTLVVIDAVRFGVLEGKDITLEEAEAFGRPVESRR